MKNIKIILLSFLVIISVFGIYKHTVSAQSNSDIKYSGLVRCDGVLDPNEPGRNVKCNFAALINTIDYIVKWIFLLTIPIFAGIIAYAGFLYMKSPSSGDRTKANAMLWTAVKGFIIMLSAWVLVASLVDMIVDPAFKGVAGSLLEQKK